MYDDSNEYTGVEIGWSRIRNVYTYSTTAFFLCHIPSSHFLASTISEFTDSKLISIVTYRGGGPPFPPSSAYLPEILICKFPFLSYFSLPLTVLSGTQHPSKIRPAARATSPLKSPHKLVSSVVTKSIKHCPKQSREHGGILTMIMPDTKHPIPLE